jgi:hypothetical protein
LCERTASFASEATPEEIAAAENVMSRRLPDRVRGAELWHG